jgi:hypothetical protein
MPLNVLSRLDSRKPPVAPQPVPEHAHHAGPSLHGDNAARRQAITELLFFSSVGDLARCQKICATWRIDVRIFGPKLMFSSS